MRSPGRGIGVFPYDMKALLLDVSYEPLDLARGADVMNQSQVQFGDGGVGDNRSSFVANPSRVYPPDV